MLGTCQLGVPPECRAPGVCLSAHTLLCSRTPSTGARKGSGSSCGPCTASSTWLLARRPRPSTCPDSPPPVTWEVRTPHQELVPPAPCTSFVGLSHWGFTCLQDRKQVYLFKKHPKDSDLVRLGLGLGRRSQPLGGPGDQPAPSTGCGALSGGCPVRERTGPPVPNSSCWCPTRPPVHPWPVFTQDGGWRRSRHLPRGCNGMRVPRGLLSCHFAFPLSLCTPFLLVTQSGC